MRPQKFTGENARSWEALGEVRPGQSSLSAGALRYRAWAQIWTQQHGHPREAPQSPHAGDCEYLFLAHDPPPPRCPQPQCGAVWDRGLPWTFLMFAWFPPRQRGGQRVESGDSGGSGGPNRGWVMAQQHPWIWLFHPGHQVLRWGKLQALTCTYILHKSEASGSEFM